MTNVAFKPEITAKADNTTFYKMATDVLLQ